MTMRKKSLLLLASVLIGVNANANVVINEIMQSNVDCLFTEHEFPDSWVELYNDSNSAVSLSGWRIGDSDTASSAWALSGNVTIGAKSYLLIYCDKDANGLHTDFRLDSSKAALYLFDSSGCVVDNISYKKQPAPNIAYGRIGDGGKKWAYYITATPGASNEGTTISDNSTIMPEPVFNRTGFVSVQGKDSFTLVVSIPEGAPDDTRLCITIDSSEPIIDNAVSGSSWSKVINSTTIVRAKLLSDKALPIRSTTQSYIYHPESTKLSVFSLVGNSSYFYSNDEGILMGEWDDNDASKQHPNWNQDWRRPINIEYYQGEDHTLLFNQVGETRIQGGYSRRNAQKSLAVYANKRFGTKRFYGELWHEKPSVTEVKSFILRNGGNCFDASRINDQVGQSAIGRFRPDMDWQAYEPAIYYLNGKYMGLTDLRERSNEDNIEANLGYDDIDMIENWYELKEGTFDEFYSFVDFYNGSDLTFDKLKERLDVDNFLDMFIIKSFGMDTDFPNNNVVLWRPRQDDGKWRFILKDIDRMGLQWMDYEIANDLCTFIDDMIKSNQYSNSSLSRQLKLFQLFYSTLPEAKDLYIDRMAIYLGDFLRTEKGQDLIDEYINDIEPEYLRHLQVYYNDVPNTNAYRYSGDWGWKGYVKYFRDTWWSKRKSNMFTMLRSRFNLGSIITLNMERNSAPVNFNDVDLAYDKYYGKWFVGRQMRLTTDAEHGWRITTTNSSNQTSVSEVYDSQLSYTPANGISTLKIEVIENANGVNDINADCADISVSRQGSDIRVECASGLQSVNIYGTDGRTYHSYTDLNGAQSVIIAIAPAQCYLIAVTPTSGTTKVIKLR
jgi:hypothetical protein